MQQVSRLTTKYQATIPKPIREALGLIQGDYVVFELNQHRHVIVRKASPMDVQHLKQLQGTLSEWTTEADEEAYRDL